jgi:hypothetical protein
VRGVIMNGGGFLWQLWLGDRQERRGLTVSWVGLPWEGASSFVHWLSAEAQGCCEGAFWRQK